MKRLVLLLALLAPLSAFAQMTFTGRAKVEADAKLFKGFHLYANEEFRSADNFAGVGSMRTTAGVSYKPVKFLKVGVGYTLINPYKHNKELVREISESLSDTTYYSGFWAPRHRIYADVGGSLRLGRFQLGLKERLQLTHNADYGSNPCQKTRNAMALKNKLTVKYKGWNFVEPALSFEARVALNDPWGTVSGSEQITANSHRKYYSYTPTGYTHAYVNRVRACLEADISLAKGHSLSPYVQFDYTMDYEIDTNSPSKWAAKGIRLFSDTTGWVYGTCLTIGVNYCYNF